MPAKSSQVDAFRDAIRHSDRQKVAEFLAQGVDLTAQIFVGLTPLTLAAGEGDRDVVQLLLNAGADINGRGENCGSVLHAAAAQGDLAMIRLLIGLGADVNARKTGLIDGGDTPLHVATFLKQIRAMKELIKAGADVNAMTDQGERTLLHIALLSGGSKNLEMAKLLIEAGADVNASDEPPLFDACREGNVEIVRTLIDAGANVNSATNLGDSVLTVTAFYGHVECVRLLLDRGADPAYRIPATHKSWPDMTALDVAKTEKKSKVVKLLEGTGLPAAAKAGGASKPTKPTRPKK